MSTTSPTQLSYDVFVSDGPAGADGERMPDGAPLAWSPLSSTLIFGARDALLVDPPLRPVLDQTVQLLISVTLTLLSSGTLVLGPSPVDRARPGSKHHVITEAHEIPLAASLTGGHRNDITQLMPLIQAIPPVRGRRGRPRQRPGAVYADRGYDHDKYRRQVRDKGIKPMIARRGTEHGSGLGVYRWVVEQSIALLHWFRPLRIRWEIRDGIHEAFLSLACAIICWRRLRILSLCQDLLRPGGPGTVPRARAVAGAACLPQAERVHLVVVGRGGEACRAAVSGAPVDAAVDDRGAAGHRAAAGEAPQDLPGRGVQGVHAGAGGGQRSAVDDAVGGADEGDVEGALQVGGLPQDLAGGRVQGRPGAAGDGLPGVRPGAAQGVGDLGGVTAGSRAYARY
jgi:hypothetical protein